MMTITEPALAARLRTASAADTELRFRVLDHGDGGSFTDSEEGEFDDPTLLPSGRSAYDAASHREWAPALARVSDELSKAGLLRSTAGGAATDEFVLDLATGAVTHAG